MNKHTDATEGQPQLLQPILNQRPVRLMLLISIVLFKLHILDALHSFEHIFFTYSAAIGFLAIFIEGVSFVVEG
jgi:hypothetical protein